MPLATGDKLGHYEIVAPIGAGGMGEVFRARDTRLKRDVAVKVLPEAFASDPNRMMRFQREAENTLYRARGRSKTGSPHPGRSGFCAPEVNAKTPFWEAEKYPRAHPLRTIHVLGNRDRIAGGGQFDLV